MAHPKDPRERTRRKPEIPVDPEKKRDQPEIEERPKKKPEVRELPRDKPEIRRPRGKPGIGSAASDGMPTPAEARSAGAGVGSPSRSGATKRIDTPEIERPGTTPRRA